jgi:hypothetical protein
MSLNIGAAGSLNLALIPNEGSTPAHTYYKVLLKLDDLKNQVHGLLGNGQPGRIRVLELHVEQHEKFMQRASGLLLIIVPVVTLLQVVLYYFRSKP